MNNSQLQSLKDHMTLCTNRLIDAAVEVKAQNVKRRQVGEFHYPELVKDEPLDADFNIHDILDEVRDHYIRRALEEANGNKTQAAHLLGLNNYQTLTNWMNNLGITG